MTNTTQSFKVAVIGAGPRGISVVERTLAGYLALPEQDRPALDIAVIDPFNPGPGHVWRTGQSRLFLMNTPCLFPTVVPAGATAAELPASPSGLSFDQWRMLMADTAAGVELPAADREELAGLTPGSFPSRAVYGRYLEWTFARLADAALAAGVALRHVRSEVLSLTRPETGSGWSLEVAGEDPLDADAVVLALGHLPAALSADQDRLRDAADRHDLRYLPPAVPSDVDFSVFPAGNRCSSADSDSTFSTS
ncbi:FAD/NAD(P)-binding protein [Arthrobacter sp. ATA002]|uniref:FAD/NAD(P)-binding protein n=1 Tax=Arthrobacter sp. ATA002 TaxID=2991715 RepID=UPI002E33397C|nr:FAD/NAD(P)-binding protein [Arthrobacter sp. ATA002]